MLRENKFIFLSNPEHYLLKVHPLFPLFCLFRLNVDDLTTLIG